MSQRSHIAHSGSSAISECSAAWSDESSSGIASRPSSWCGLGTNQTASVSNVVGGRSSGTVSSVEPSAIAFFWYATTCSVTETRPKESSRPSRRSTRSGSSIAVVRLLLRLRVPVALERLDERAPRGEVELAHEVLAAEVEVDGALVDGGVGALALGEPERRRRSRRRRRGTRRAKSSGAVCARPASPCRPRPSRARCLRSSGTCGARSSASGAERRGVAVVDRRLERGRRDVAVEHARVRVVEDRRLDAPVEQRLRLAHEVLVERVLGGDEDREAVLAAAGASPLLAEARDRSREADRDRAVEVADVDAELERVGRRDAEEVALDEPPLDLAPLLRRVAGAVRSEPRPRSRRRAGRPRSGGSAPPTCGSSRSRSCAGRGRRARRAAATLRRARSPGGRARRRAAAGSRARSSARRAVPHRPRRRSPPHP